jgi:hypothetical protein
MRRRLILVAAAAVLVVLALSGSVWAFSGAGSGTEADPYIITTVEQLQEMENDLTTYYVLGNDIDASGTVNWNGGTGFVPIGTFTGTFDGRGYTITGFYINRPTTNGLALFGGTVGAEIKNVGMADVDITGRMAVGALVNYNDDNSTICNCWSSGNVRSTYVGANVSGVGGLVGSNADGSFISKCYSTANVTGNDAWQYGGLVGRNIRGSIIVDCYATGDVSGTHKVGGLVGDNMHGAQGGYVARCYSTGKVAGNGGGLIGYNWKSGVTYDSYWDTKTSGKSSSKGGTGKTTTQMIQQDTFVNWDFVEVWDIVENETYPFLRPLLKPILVGVDIKPGSCPNPLNVKSRGLLPVAVLGSEDFDVSSIDAASIRLAGVAPIRSSYEDVATPVSDSNECECSTEGPDGFLDLTLKFETQSIVEAIGEVNHDDELMLELTGVLSDETPIEGSDCVTIRGKHKPLNRADFNGDGIVDMADFAAFSENWLQLSIVEY